MRMKTIKTLSNFSRYIYRDIRFYLVLLPRFYVSVRSLSIKANLMDKAIVLKSLPAEKLRVHWFHKATGDSINPLCLASKLYVREKNFANLVALFDSFRDKYRLDSADDLLGLSESVFNASESIFKSGFPWDETGFEDVQKMREENIRLENLVFGLDTYCYFGSEKCSYEKAEVEAKRVSYLIDDISENGYDFNKNEDCVKVIILKYKRNYAALVAGGNHRVAALISGFGYKEVDAKLVKIVDRAHVRSWKHVRNGTYSESQALQVFDAIMNGTLPKAFDKWGEFLRASDFFKELHSD